MRATNDQRLEILKLVVSNSDPKTDIISRAKLFETYVTGEDVDISNSPSQVGELLEEPKAEPARRGRKSKEPETKNVGQPQDGVSSETPQASPPTVSYLQVQQAVVALVMKKGRPAAEKVLEQFGVEHAQKLKPESYAEVTEALKAAVDE